ncbi:hypothetical protein WR25_16234 isoform B [Diploscapter pachys]|uniref:Uncharacterized protein n=1 Tax=Diploscapter pachys TaxID=2018661 RepID=A0A2A2KNJ8_9BILA|nr:hypothetical protein WR25_16234 isoform B [Diploscapter pachys]
MLLFLFTFGQIFIFTNAGVLEHFVYKDLPLDKLKEAREFGKKAYLAFRNATDKIDDVDIRNEMYEDFILNCTELGKDVAHHIIDKIKTIPLTKNSRLLLSMGMQPFVAKFLSMNQSDMSDGIDRMCKKYESQLQCQLGFGESRPAIYKRIEDMKNTNGNLKLLIEKDCNSGSNKYEAYRCIGEDAQIWSQDCKESMTAYNESRFRIGKKVAKLHIEAVEHVLNITSNVDLDKEDQLMSSKEYVQAIFRPALREIAELEGEKCSILEKVLKCVRPSLRKHCGAETEEVFNVSVLVGYVRNILKH